MFTISSSTASATTTLFSISNTGAITTSLGTGCVTSTSGLLSVGSSCGTVTSVATNNGLTGGTITTTGTIGLATIAANTVLANQTNASAVPTALATSSLFTLGGGLTQSSTLLQQVEHRSFTYATSTTWTGTTTIPLETGYGEVWNTIRCFTDVGTLNVQVGYGSASTTIFNASTTNGTVTVTPNNTMTAGNKVLVDIGTPATAPTKINCTAVDTY